MSGETAAAVTWRGCFSPFIYFYLSRGRGNVESG
jgi:hypothetical protein